MHFTPNRNDIVPNDGTLLLRLNGSVIKRVIETKFLGVIIDDKLKWQSHTSFCRNYNYMSDCFNQLTFIDAAQFRRTSKERISARGRAVNRTGHVLPSLADYILILQKR